MQCWFCYFIPCSGYSHIGCQMLTGSGQPVVSSIGCALRRWSVIETILKYIRLSYRIELQGCFRWCELFWRSKVNKQNVHIPCRTAYLCSILWGLKIVPFSITLQFTHTIRFCFRCVDYDSIFRPCKWVSNRYTSQMLYNGSFTRLFDQFSFYQTDTAWWLQVLCSSLHIPHTSEHNSLN